MYDYHAILAAIAALLGIVGYALYFRSIFRGITRPHVFTWFTYFLIDIIVFTAQIIKGGGPGAWVTLTGVVGTLGVTILALRWGEKRITTSDWASFAGALCAIVLWRATGDPLIAVVIAVVINFLAMLPTFRKSFIRPGEESISIWVLDIIRYSIAMAALASFNVTTALFPAALGVGDALLVAMIVVRRSRLAKRGRGDTMASNG